MIVYHGSNQVVEKPEIQYSGQFLDFGPGFYMTSFQKQAEKWALRKSIRARGTAIVNIYEFADDLSKFNVLKFENANEQWLDFVCACRRGEKIYEPFDIVVGNVANDDVFKTIDMYYRGIWDKSKTLEELRYYKQNDQICILKQETLDVLLQFSNSYAVKQNG